MEMLKDDFGDLSPQQLAAPVDTVEVKKLKSGSVCLLAMLS